MYVCVRKRSTQTDGLAQTVPMWCCVLNTAAARVTPRAAGTWDTHLYLPPTVGTDEVAAIAARVPGWVDAFLGLQLEPLLRLLRRLDVRLP
jgi:hypothetical protein